MSRRPRMQIWYQWFHTAISAMCPVCGVNEMKRDDDTKEKWHREHILRLGLGGPDTFPNLIPICKQCNLGMGKATRSTFDYMVRIGRMSEEQANFELSCHIQRCNLFQPKCEATIGSAKGTPKQCSNLKGGKDETCCWKHIRALIETMDCSDN